YPRVSSRLVACGFCGSRDFQRRVLDPSVFPSMALAGRLRPFRMEILDPIQRDSDGASPRGLVEARLVLYPVISAGGAVVSLQHDCIGARYRNRMATDTLQTGVTQ